MAHQRMTLNTTDEKVMKLLGFVIIEISNKKWKLRDTDFIKVADKDDIERYDEVSALITNNASLRSDKYALEDEISDLKRSQRPETQLSELLDTVADLNNKVGPYILKKFEWNAGVEGEVKFALNEIFHKVNVLWQESRSKRS